MIETERFFSDQVVLPGGVCCAEVVARARLIELIEPKSAPSVHAHDWRGDIIIPGLVDIHTDNLEKHYQPRPGALWDAFGAAIAHDAQCAAAGITTVFDSLSLHGRKDGLDRGEALAPMIAAMDQASAQGMLRAEHLLHLRCEITNPQVLDLVEPHLDNPRLRLLSVMDHTPGQRQTSDLSRYRTRLVTGGKSEEEVAELMGERQDWRDQASAPRIRQSIVAIARQYGVPLASHDDAAAEHVDEACVEGAAIAEFPVTFEAAKRARELGLFIFMGAPNFVRGGSHSGNLSARDCAEAGLLDALTSDYIPLSMLRAAFQLSEAPFGWPLEKAIDTVAGAPARACGLNDRGALAEGQRADLVRIHRNGGGWPIVREVWRAGRRVA